jgi:hypothetical protein
MVVVAAGVGHDGDIGAGMDVTQLHYIMVAENLMRYLQEADHSDPLRCA